MSVLSVDLALLHHRELYAKFALGEVQYLLRGAGLLAAELVAGESQDLISFVSPALMVLDHLLIVLGGDASLGGYVDDHDQVFVFESSDVKGLSKDVVDFEVEEALTGRDCQLFLTVFHD